MQLLGRVVAIGFLIVLCVAAVVPPLDGLGDCRAVQYVPAGGSTPIVTCSTVNCEPSSACQIEVYVVEGELWHTCRCAGQLAACASAWAIEGSAVYVLCITDQCPVPYVCSRQDATPQWGALCDCEVPPLEG
ncbi:MAG: hypothetical protein IT457_04185 [Planctomycetes bacterium]|nr:hypothetical protein [Planctomycetota bacterium]